ncbi:MAG: hypothetical protein ABJH78_07610, partial [Lentilitoribacter sp.]
VARGIERARAADVRIFLMELGQKLMLEPGGDDIILLPKADLSDDNIEGVSGLTGLGVADLIEKIEKFLTIKSAGAGLATHERHRSAMEEAQIGLTRALEVVNDGPDQYDIAAEELRSAIRQLEVLTGRINVENLLDEVFSSFCLGK